MALLFYIWFQLFSCAQGAIIWEDPLKDASSVNWVMETASEYSSFRYSTSQFCPNGEYGLYFSGNYSAHHIHSTLNYTNISITASISGLAMEPNDFCSIYYSDSTSINWVKAGSWTTTGSTTTFNVQDIKIYLPQTTANNPSVGIKLQSETFKSVSGDADQCYFSDIIMEGISVFTNDPTQSPSFDPSNAPISSTRTTPQFPSVAPLNQDTSSPISTSISSTLISQTQTITSSPAHDSISSTTQISTGFVSVSSSNNHTQFPLGSTSIHRTNNLTQAADNILLIIIFSVAGCAAIVCNVWLFWYCSRQKKAREANQAIFRISDAPKRADNNKNEGENEKKMIREWLTSTVGLDQYTDLFINNGYDSLEMIANIKTKEDLIEIGIMKAGHRKHILSNIEMLKEEENNQQNVIIDGGNNVDDIRQVEGGTNVEQMQTETHTQTDTFQNTTNYIDK